MIPNGLQRDFRRSVIAMLQQLRFGQGFALSPLAITAHQDVTLLTDTTR